MPYTQSEFSYNEEVKQRVLLVGCSGGAGHNSAICGIQHLAKFEVSDIKRKPINRAASSWRVAIAARVTHVPLLGGLIRAVLDHTSFPNIPSPADLSKEQAELLEKNKNHRSYVDMLLDAYPHGYEGASVWNVLQSQDKVGDLTKLITFQAAEDAGNYQDVKRYFHDQLRRNYNDGKPLTAIISTQALSLSALCDAVIEYNHLHEKDFPPTPKVIIHQYMTDLPTRGAVHFFNPLSRLTAVQRQQMQLYAVGITPEIANDCIMDVQGILPSDRLKVKGFLDIFDIPATNNPMVRAGFKDPQYDNSKKFDSEVTLHLLTKTTEESEHTIKPGEQIGSIMLGSQASNDSVKYIQRLLDGGMDKVFVFGGYKTEIAKGIAVLIKADPSYEKRIIPLPNQQDKHIAQLMTRSNVVVIRGGGLSVMEQMALPHHPKQQVFIHHADSPKLELTSGISWEDENVDALIVDLSKKGILARKTAPAKMARDIPEARLMGVLTEKLPSMLGLDDVLDWITLSNCVGKLTKEQLSASYLASHSNEHQKNSLDDIKKRYDQQKALEIKIVEKMTKECQSYLNAVKQCMSSEELAQCSSEKITTLSPLDSHPKIRSFNAMSLLHNILIDKTKSSGMILADFQKTYNRPDIKLALDSCKENFLVIFLRKIEELLRKIFRLNPPSKPMLASSIGLFHKGAVRVKSEIIADLAPDKDMTPVY